MGNKRWTQEETDLLLDCQNKPLQEILEIFPQRSIRSIYSRCFRLGVSILDESVWTPDEIKILMDNKHLSLNEICVLIPKRTKHAIITRCSILKIKIERVSSDWIQEEIDIIRNNQDKTLEEICALLPSKNSKKVCNFIRRNGFLYKSKYSVENGNLLCIKCNSEKIYDNTNFILSLGKLRICRECRNKITNIKKYKSKYNIDLDFAKMFDTYTPEEWYDFYYNKVLLVLPLEISRNRDCMMTIFKYAITNILNKKTRNEIITLNSADLETLRLSHISRNSSMCEQLNIVFPEHNIKPWELGLVPSNFWRDRNNCDDFMKWFIAKNIDTTDKNIKTYIPSIFNRYAMEDIANFKMNACISYYKHYESYWHWINHLFPEWNLTSDDFKLHMAYDGSKLNSREELLIYEFIKTTYNINIISIGIEKKHKMYNEICNESYCPDFKVLIGETDKPLFIEYYGLYGATGTHDYITTYQDKTLRKNQYYKNNENIYFIDLYPEDLKYNFQGVRDKLTSFL